MQTESSLTQESIYDEIIVIFKVLTKFYLKND